jgi:RecA/RadA recombinase
MYYCGKCGHEHEFDSGVGRRHRKYAEDGGSPPPPPLDEGDGGELTQEEIDAAPEEREQEPPLDTVTLSSVPGVSDELEIKLKSVGILTPMNLAALEPDSLVELLHGADIKGVGPKTAEKLIDGAREASGERTTNAKYMYREFLKAKDPKNIIVTGSPDLDYLIGGEEGGWILGTSVELYGVGATGKSELALQAAVNAFAPAEMGGLRRGDFVPQVLVIDTEGTMRLAVSRIPAMCEKLAEALNFDEEHTAELVDEVLDNFDIRECRKSAQQQSIAVQSHRKMLTGERNYTIVIVDSLVNLFRIDYDENMSKLAPRQRAINRHIRTLKDITALSITPDGLPGLLICCNQAQHKPTMFGDGLDNIGGNVVKHNLDIRLELRQSRGNKLKAKQVDSSFRPGGEALFTINEWGIGGQDGESSVDQLVRESQN